MIVKVYSYQVQEDKIEKYLEIQQEVMKIYREYIQFEAVYLQNQTSPTKWIEMAIYECEEEEYHNSMRLINEHDDIEDHFQSF